MLEVEKELPALFKKARKIIKIYDQRIDLAIEEIDLLEDKDDITGESAVFKKWLTDFMEALNWIESSGTQSVSNLHALVAGEGTVTD